MSTDWIPFGKPMRYKHTESNGVYETEGWALGWRQEVDDTKEPWETDQGVEHASGIMYLLADGAYQWVKEGDRMEFAE